MSMSSSFAALKKSTPDYEKLLKNIKGQQSNNKKDERFWMPTLGQDKTADAIIRFLPAPPDEDQAFVKVFSHGFQVGPKWFIEECPTTIGKECPVCEENSRLWSTKINENEEIAKKRKRKAAYIANIYVVKEPNAPQNEGKTFLFKVNLQTMGHIEEMLKPSIDRDERVAVEDFWKGANYVLKVRRQGEFPSYKDSVFQAQGPLLKDDAALEQIWKQLTPLKEFHEEGPRFKSFDDLKRKFDDVLRSASAPQVQANKVNLAGQQEASAYVGKTASPPPFQKASSDAGEGLLPWEDAPVAGEKPSELDDFMKYLNDDPAK